MSEGGGGQDGKRGDTGGGVLDGDDWGNTREYEGDGGSLGEGQKGGHCKILIIVCVCDQDLFKNM